MQAFEPYIALNSHVKKPVIHISLNPSPKDILSEEQMTVLAQEFMEKFGYGSQPYIVWLHEDINRKHMHIVSVRINEKGEKIDHNREAVRAQNICREMEVKYGLHPTLGEHGERELLFLQKSGLSERQRESAGKAYRPYITGMLQLPFTCRIQHPSEFV